jgi:hypothetical protein
MGRWWLVANRGCSARPGVEACSNCVEGPGCPCSCLQLSGSPLYPSARLHPPTYTLPRLHTTSTPINLPVPHPTVKKRSLSSFADRKRVLFVALVSTLVLAPQPLLRDLVLDLDLVEPSLDGPDVRRVLLHRLLLGSGDGLLLGIGERGGGFVEGWGGGFGGFDSGGSVG